MINRRRRRRRRQQQHESVATGNRPDYRYNIAQMRNCAPAGRPK